MLGNPSNAAPSTASADNYLMVKPQFVMSYNNKTHTANWVSWQLNSSWVGAAVSKNDLCPDDALPANWYKVRPNDYIGSGYDPGHMGRLVSPYSHHHTIVRPSKVSELGSYSGFRCIMVQ